MQASYIVTFVGDDRPGLVEELSGAVERNGGNWHESRLAELRGKFAGLILVSVPGERGAALEQDLRALASGGLEVTVTASGTAAAPPTGRGVRLRVLGPDRPGIVKEISHALAARGINVQEMDSRVASAPMSAESIFEASIEARVPGETDLDSLRDSLDEIAGRMTLEIDLE